MIKRIVVLAMVGLMAACSSSATKEQQPAGVEDKSPGQKAAQPPAAGAETKPMGQEGVGGNPLTAPGSILAKRSIYFEFDSFVIKDEYKPLIEAHANYLKQNPKAKVILQGNADERGSREYNLALGQKRADAVKKAMEVLGVPDARVESVSFGEEKPKASGHDEESWAQNRRSDIVYQGE
jgi:peptidoglycan-associated lipoprotein